MTMPDGWNAGMHGMLELYGIATKWRPRPYATIGDATLEKLAAFLQSRKLP